MGFRRMGCTQRVFSDGHGVAGMVAVGVALEVVLISGQMQ